MKRVNSRPPNTTGSAWQCVVAPGVGSSRAILVAEDHGQAFLAPDNGLLGPVLTDHAIEFRLGPLGRHGATVVDVDGGRTVLRIERRVRRNRRIGRQV